jgi:putative aminopeptidase FrvX
LIPKKSAAWREFDLSTMNSNLLEKLAERLMRHPAAAYREEGVRGEVESICNENGLDCRRDSFGNLWVSWEKSPGGRPLVLAAHMDHPGFEIVRKLGSGKWKVRFLGGVADSYFKPGTGLRLMPGKVKARLGKRISKKKEFEVFCEEEPVQKPDFAVWDLEEYAMRNGVIWGRACDDLVGVASILGVMLELKRRRSKSHVIGLLTRAEEIGFHGALAVAASRRLPKNGLIISLEASQERPPVKMGEGVIIRVGDRTSIFDSAATRFLTETAMGLQKQSKSFSFQRALMPGGTCEATAFQEFGYQTGAVCVALGNYHNQGARYRIEAEHVRISDACGMVELLVRAAMQMEDFEKITGKLPERLNTLLREAREGFRRD